MKHKRHFSLKDRLRDAIFDLQFWQSRSFCDDALVVILLLVVAALSLQCGALIKQRHDLQNSVPASMRWVTLDGRVIDRRIGPTN
jgi:hypothetical protein